MPTYDYQCKKCGKQFEVFQSISAEKLTLCPENICEENEKGTGEIERKVGGGVGLIFNGNGFYLTDYARASSTTPKPAKSSGE